MPPPVFDDEALGKAFDAKLTRKALVFVRPHKKRIIYALIAMAFTSAAGLTAPYLNKVAIDDGIKKRDPELLTKLALIYVGVYLVYWVSQCIQARLVARLGNSVIYDIRSTLFAHIQYLSLDFFDKRQLGRIIARLTSDVNALNQMLTSGALTLVADIITLSVVAFIMSRMDSKLAILTFSLVPLMLIIATVFRGKARVAYRDVRRKSATVTAKVAENVSGVKAVKSFSREKENLRQFEQVNQESQQATMHAVKIASVLFPLMLIIGSLGVCLIFWYGTPRIQAGTLTVGVLVAFYGYMQRFFQPIQHISQFYHQMQGAMAGAERIFEILDTEPTVKDKPDAFDMPRIKGDVEFKHVTFGYDDKPILKDVSFTAKAGETIALVGPTGAGKTTIINLIARQYDIQEGAILIDGTDIRNVTTRSLRSQIGVVLQDSFLFPVSVKDNIRYGRLDATDQEVEAAAKTIGAHEFIAALPQGYKTDVREGGSKLSTGQKQLVCFTRALLADPRILILDEATSSIDAYTEMLIQDALRKLRKGRTSFVVAHRLSTILEADKIMVIQDGRIAESGTHSELLQQDGLYKKLYEVQFVEGVERVG